MKELIWMFDADYVIHSYVQLFAMLYVFSTAVLNYTIYINHLRKFLRNMFSTAVLNYTIYINHLRKFLHTAVVHDCGGMRMGSSLPLAMPYQTLTGIISDVSILHNYLCNKVVCDSVCLFPRISVSFACMGLTFCKRARGSTGMVRTLKQIQNAPGGGVLCQRNQCVHLT